MGTLVVPIPSGKQSCILGEVLSILVQATAQTK